MLTVRDIEGLAVAIDQRYRALILLAIFCSLRWGELAALRRSDIDLAAGTVRITRQVTTLSSGRQVIGVPKSAAGNRVVVVPAVIIPPLQLHLRWLAQPGEDACSSLAPKVSPSDMTTSAVESGIPRFAPPDCRAFISMI